MGNLISVIDEEGMLTTYTYDPKNQKLTESRNDQRISYSYNELGALTSTTDAKGNKTTLEYNSINQLIKKVEAEGTEDESIVSYEYDERDNLIKIYRGEGTTKRVFKSYQYDELNRVKEQSIRGEGNSVTKDIYDYEVDRVNHKTTTTVTRVYEDEPNRVIETTYDALNRKVKVSVDGTETESYSYDSFSRLKEAKNQNHTVTFESYNDLNQVTSETQDSYTISKTYDATQNLTSITLPNSRVVEKTYNQNSLLTTISYDNNNIATLSYNRRGQITKQELGNGVVQTLSYDTNAREEQREYKKSNEILYKEDTSYDLNSNIVKKATKELNSYLIANYTYDAKDRVKSNSLLNHYFNYDNQDNIVATNHNGKEESREANVDNEYVNIKANSQEVTIEYDKDGNLKRYNNQTFSYDYLNRLIKVEEDDITVATFTYDALNRRVTKTADNQTTRYIYNNDRVIQEITDNQQNDITYIYGAYKDDPIAFIKDNQTYYYIKDRQYSIEYITDQEANIVESYSYTSYGITTIKDQNNNTITEPMQSYGFTGRRYDSETKLYHYRNRVYSPTLGRFIQTDPKGYVDGYNLYAYVKNNPLRYLDPMGTTARYGSSLSFPNITDDAYIQIGTNYDNLEGTSFQYPKYEYSSTGLVGIGSDVDMSRSILHGDNIFYENDFFQIKANINFNDWTDNNSIIGMVFTDKFINETNKLIGEEFTYNGIFGEVYIGVKGTLLKTTKTTLSVFDGEFETFYKSPTIFNSEIKGTALAGFSVGNFVIPYIRHQLTIKNLTHWDAEIEGGVGFHTYEGTIGYELEGKLLGFPLRKKDLSTGTYGGYSIFGRANANADGDTLTYGYKWKYTRGKEGEGTTYEREFGIPEKIKSKKWQR